MASVADLEEQELLRRQVEATLRFMRLSTIVGLVVVVILAIAVPSIRGVMILVGIVYLLTSVAAYAYLRRNFKARLERGLPAASPAPTDPE